MLYKIMFKAITVMTVICLSFNMSFIYATQNNTIENTSITEVAGEQNSKKITDAQYSSIVKILEYISKELKSIDDKISYTRTLIEFNKYPAVRLNIDTPYFGLTSIVNSKLKIRDNVSTVDVATGYSIRNIVNKKVMKIPTFEVSNIVVITRDVNLDKEMTYNDAHIAIFNLLDYLEQVKGVNKFVDKQLTNIIIGYYSKEKNDVIYNINTEIEEIKENLNYSLSELSYIKAFTENDITQEISTLYKYRTDVNSIEILLKDVHTSKTKLEEVYTNIQNMNKEIKTYRFNVNKKYLEVENTLDLEKAASLINLNMTNELNYLQAYLDNSKIEVVEDTNIDSTNLDVTNETVNEQNDQTMTLTKQTKYNEIYKVTSETIVQSMKKDYEKAKTILNDITTYNLTKAQEAENKGQSENSQPTTDVNQVEKIKEINTKETIDELMRIYIGFLNKENVFLTENAKINITETKKMSEININSFEDIEYVYINLSSILTNISDNYVSSSVISNMKTSNSLKDVITKIIASSKNMKKQEVTLP